MFEREDWRVKNLESRVWKTGLCLYQRRHTMHFDRCCRRCQVISFVPDSVRPHRWQPTRLPHPWDSPGKNTGVGSPVHESEKWKWSCSVVSDSSQPHELQPIRLLRTWDLPSKSTGVGCHCLLRFWPQSFLIVDFVCDHWPVARSAPENFNHSSPPTISPLFHMPKGMLWLELFVFLTFCCKPYWTELSYEKITLWVNYLHGLKYLWLVKLCLVSKKEFPGPSHLLIA